MSILDVENPKREAALDALTSSIAQTQTNRENLRSEVKRSHERDLGADHGVTGGEMTKEVRRNASMAANSAEIKWN